MIMILLFLALSRSLLCTIVIRFTLFKDSLGDVMSDCFNSFSFLSNLNFGTFPLIFFLLSQGFFLLPSSLAITIILLSSPQPSPQWVNYVIKIRNYLHSPTFFQLHWPSFIISQDNPDITIDLLSTPRSSLRQQIIIPLSLILMMLLPSISIFTLLHHHLTFQLVMPTSSPSSTPLYLHSLQYPFLPTKFEQNSINLLEHFLTSTFISLPSSFSTSLIPLLSPSIHTY